MKGCWSVGYFKMEAAFLVDKSSLVCHFLTVVLAEEEKTRSKIMWKQIIKVLIGLPRAGKVLIHVHINWKCIMCQTENTEITKKFITLHMGKHSDVLSRTIQLKYGFIQRLHALKYFSNMLSKYLKSVNSSSTTRHFTGSENLHIMCSYYTVYMLFMMSYWEEETHTHAHIYVWCLFKKHMCLI